MYSEPVIVETKDLSKRAYIKTYIDGKRFRLYNGFQIGVSCSPNRSKTLKERSKALQHLCFQFKKKLEKGWTPDAKQNNHAVRQVVHETGSAIEEILREIDTSDLSSLYQRDIRNLGLHFISFLKNTGLYNSPITSITSHYIENYLSEFKISATYYMNKRRTLGAIFSRILGKGLITINPVLKTSKLKEKCLLHEPYTKEQIGTILGVLKEQNPNLYLCALLMYGCLLRPHQEIRLLNRGDFDKDWLKISLSGRSNKSGRIRVVQVPEYVRTVLFEQNKQLLSNTDNLFTGTDNTLNESYFNTAWGRIKSDLLQKKKIGQNQTLYSFRHTAAINLYMKTRDLFKVQQVMGHSSMTVTITYMRSLGQINSLSIDDIPDLLVH